MQNYKELIFDRFVKSRVPAKWHPVTADENVYRTLENQENFMIADLLREAYDLGCEASDVELAQSERLVAILSKRNNITVEFPENSWIRFMFLYLLGLATGLVYLWFTQ